MTPIPDLPASNRFLSYVGDTVQFAVPDTGTPGAVVTGYDADGTEWDQGGIIVQAQEQTVPIVATDDNPRPGQPDIGPRLMVRLAKPWTLPGVYRFRVDQNGVVTEYEYTVLVKAAYGNRADERRFVREAKAWKVAMRNLPQTNQHTPNFNVEA